MKTQILILIISIAFPFLSFGQTYTELIKEANELYQEEEYVKSNAKFKEAFKLVETPHFMHLYYGARSAALAGDEEAALAIFEKKGWVSNWSYDKSDFKWLYKTKKWKKRVAKRQENYDKELKSELNRIFADDQSIRWEIELFEKELGREHPKVDELVTIMREKDKINVTKIEKILEEHGWVGTDLVGTQANFTIFLVILHAGLETQQKYLPMMRDAVEKGNARGSSLAFLEDRVALMEDKKQLYGSQIGIYPVTGEAYILPLEDPDNVDERRKSVGLGPLINYAHHWGLNWDIEAYKQRLPEYEEWNKKK